MMDDLISRQKAIENMAMVIWGYPNEIYPQLNDLTMALELAKDGLMGVPSAQQWIPVEKETPILPNIVLVCDSLGKILFDSYIDGSWTYCPYVVAWMPLPEPHKEGNG